MITLQCQLELNTNDKNTLLKEEIKRINKDIRMLIKNLNSDSETQDQGNQRKEPVR